MKGHPWATAIVAFLVVPVVARLALDAAREDKLIQAGGMAWSENGLIAGGLAIPAAIVGYYSAKG